VVVFLVVVIVVPVVGWMAWSRGAARAVEDELSKIREAGEPTSASELNQFFALPNRNQDATQLWLDGLALIENSAFNDDSQELPIIGPGPDIPLPGQPWAQLEASEEFLDKYGEAMAKFHQAADIGGRARYEIDFEKGFSGLLPMVNHQRTIARLLALEANVRAHRGDAHGAAQSVQALFAATRAQEAEPLLMSQLVRVAIDGMAVDQTQRLISSVNLADDDLVMLQNELRSIRFQAGQTRALIGERAMGIEIFRNPSKHGSNVRFRIFIGDTDLAFYLQTTRRWIAASREPFPAALDAAQKIKREFQSETQSPINQAHFALTAQLLPAFSASMQATARGDAGNLAMDAAIAVQRFRKANGKLPQSLDELVPDYLPSVPLDPFDGQPLRYVIDEAGAFRVYSLGRNRTDEGGVLDDVRLDEVFSIKQPQRNAKTTDTPEPDRDSTP